MKKKEEEDEDEEEVRKERRSSCGLWVKAVRLGIVENQKSF